MKDEKVFWTIGCWISLLLVFTYHNLFHSHQSVLPVWYATFVVWITGLVALSSLKKEI